MLLRGNKSLEMVLAYSYQVSGAKLRLIGDYTRWMCLIHYVAYANCYYWSKLARLNEIEFLASNYFFVLS